MIDLLIPFFMCLACWWLGTGIVLRLNGQPERLYRISMAGFTMVALAMVSLVVVLRGSTTVWSAYGSFCAAMIVWGWLEFLHYSGCLVGPGVKRCPAGVSTGRRFISALHAMLYHEIAVALVGVGLIVMLWDSPNKTALYTYLVLWVMRISAELNVFFGIANLPEEWLPEKLRYLMSYRKHKRINAFFPFSITFSTIACIWIFLELPLKTVDAFDYTSGVLTGTLLLLAIVEHWLLVVPVKGERLWSWAHS